MASGSACHGARFRITRPSPHDLSPDRRALAVELGAEQVSSKELVRRCSVREIRNN